MRIIAGKHKGRRIDAPEGKAVRPTSGRTREAVFNILGHGEFGGDKSPVTGRHVADLFCGTGAFGLEALSRGAAGVTFVDNSEQALSLARANAEHFGEGEAARFLRCDAARLPRARARCALAFLDPPYHGGLVTPALKSLLEAGWLEPGAVVVVEQSEKERFDIPAGLTPQDERRYGNTRITLLRAVL